MGNTKSIQMRMIFRISLVAPVWSLPTDRVELGGCPPRAPTDPYERD